jgi:hypothetical protein
VRYLRRLHRHAWEETLQAWRDHLPAASASAFLLFLLGAIYAYRLLGWDVAVDEIVLTVATGVLPAVSVAIGIYLWCLVKAPLMIYVENRVNTATVGYQRNVHELQASIQVLKEARPVVVFRMGERLMDGTFAGYFSNLSDEAAINVRIKDWQIDELTVTANEAVPLLRREDGDKRVTLAVREGDSFVYDLLGRLDTLAFEGLLSDLFRKEKDARLGVVAKLLVVYSDRRGSSWETPHALFFQGDRVWVEPVEGKSVPRWTSWEIPSDWPSATEPGDEHGAD